LLQTLLAWLLRRRRYFPAQRASAGYRVEASPKAPARCSEEAEQAACKPLAASSGYAGSNPGTCAGHSCNRGQREQQLAHSSR